MAGREIKPLDIEEDIAIGRSSRSDKKFDITVGHIEDIIMDDAFQELQNEFMDKHYHHFEDVEENKLIYTDIFQQYVSKVEIYRRFHGMLHNYMEDAIPNGLHPLMKLVELTEETMVLIFLREENQTNLIEKHLEESLKQRMPGFSMDEFMALLRSRKDQIGGDIFDMLLSFSDFLMFKQMFLDYKADKEGRNVDLGGLIITPLSSGDVQNTAEEMMVVDSDTSVDRQTSTNVLLSS